MVNENDILQQLEALEGEANEEAEETPEVIDEVEDETPDPVAALKQEYDSQLAELRRSVGRVQSLASQFNNGKVQDNTDTELREQFAKTSEQLDLLVNGLEDVIDPDTRARILLARQQARDAAERTSLKKELMEELAPPPVVTPDARAVADRYESELLAEIKGYGLDPDDEAFDWKQAGQLYSSGDIAGMQRYIREQIRTSLTAAAPDGRRQARKDAGTPAPTPKGAGGKTDFERVLEDGDITDLDGAIKELEKLGINL